MGGGDRGQCNHNKEIKDRAERADRPCALQQVHFLALDGAGWPVLQPEEQH